MNEANLQFILLPLLIYTYFWINPSAIVEFFQGVARTFVEIYLGYKEYKLWVATQMSFTHYRIKSILLARHEGLSLGNLASYFRTYGEKDWNYIYDNHRNVHESKYRNFEEGLRDMIYF